MQLLLGCFGSVPPKALDGSFDVGHFMSDFILDVGHVICCCSAVSAADRQRLWKLIQLLIHLACPSSACSGVWPFRIRCQQFRHYFLAAFFLACVLHALGTKLAAVRGFRKLRIGAFCLAWARILLLFGRFAWAPSRHHGTSADGLAWALLSAPPRHLALRYTGFGPSLAARVLATRNVLWIPKVTGSIFSGLCFWLA